MVEKMISIFPFVIWMLLYIPCICIAEYFYVKSGHDKLSNEHYTPYFWLYLIIGLILLIYGC